VWSLIQLAGRISPRKDAMLFRIESRHRNEIMVVVPEVSSQEQRILYGDISRRSIRRNWHSDLFERNMSQRIYE